MRRVGHTKERCSELKGPHREVTSVAASMITSCNYLSICVFVCAAEAPTAQSPSPSFSPWSGCGPPRSSPFKDQCWSPSANVFLLLPLCYFFFSSEDMLHSLSAEQTRVMAHKKTRGSQHFSEQLRLCSFSFQHKAFTSQSVLCFPHVLPVSSLKMMMNSVNVT